MVLDKHFSNVLVSVRGKVVHVLVRVLAINSIKIRVSIVVTKISLRGKVANVIKVYYFSIMVDFAFDLSIDSFEVQTVVYVRYSVIYGWSSIIDLIFENIQNDADNEDASNMFHQVDFPDDANNDTVADYYKILRDQKNISVLNSVTTNDVVTAIQANILANVDHSIYFSVDQV